MEQRPVGVSIIALLSLIDGFINFGGGYGLVTLSGWALGGYAFSYLTYFSPPPGVVASTSTYIVLGCGAMILGAGQLAFAWGAWKLADWGWLLGLGLAAVGVILALFALLSDAVALTAPLASLLVPVLIGGYLLVPSTRHAFGLVTVAEAEQP